MNLDSLDERQRTPLQVAEASKAASTAEWISNWQAQLKIQRFTRRHCQKMLARRRKERFNTCATVIQKNARGRFARKCYHGPILLRLEESQRFAEIWTAAIKQVPLSACATSSVWESIQDKIDMKKADLVDAEGNLCDTDKTLFAALSEAMEYGHKGEEGIDDVNYDDNAPNAKDSNHTFNGREITDKDQWLSFQVTSHVVKFLKNGDNKYKGFFVRRMLQLAKGDRSRILQKRLKGSSSIICECYGIFEVPSFFAFSSCQ